VLLGQGRRFRIRRRGTSHAAFDRRASVSWRQVEIPERHRHSLVAHQLPDGHEVDAFHRQTAGEGVSEVVEAEIFDRSSPLGW
jgi:hypothetical protein